MKAGALQVQYGRFSSRVVKEAGLTLPSGHRQLAFPQEASGLGTGPLIILSLLI